MNEIGTVLLRKLAKHGYWGDRHTAFANLHKGFPGHLGKQVKESAEELIRENLLIPKPTAYGLHVYCPNLETPTGEGQHLPKLPPKAAISMQGQISQNLFCLENIEFPTQHEKYRDFLG